MTFLLDLAYSLKIAIISHTKKFITKMKDFLWNSVNNLRSL